MIRLDIVLTDIAFAPPALRFCAATVFERSYRAALKDKGAIFHMVKICAMPDAAKIIIYVL